MYLVIDTATSILGLALVDSSGLVGELAWRTNQNHTAELIPSLRHLLNKAATELHDLQGIVVAKGPGSFTGLRVGMATAKGLAISTGAPLVGISTLEAWAYPYATTGLAVCPMLEVRRGELAAALFRWTGGLVDRVMTEHITTVDDLCPRLQESTIFCGQVSPDVAARLKKLLGARALVVEAEHPDPRLLYLGQLGRQKIEGGQADDPATLQPLYLRQPSITRPSKAKSGTS
ncbi:MAG: tRNA (adenosine(37)-N6)-threonylcarbamoyltransferase complex dimerization subunit type 1 TsaB [Dehalococcoidia bacterium]